MERAYDDAKYGRYSRRPYIDIVIPSLTDPSVAPPGKHVLSCFVQYAPYKLAQGTWDEQREAFGDNVVDTLAEYAPNLKKIIVGRQILTPLDLEREFGLTQGNIFQGELSLEQLFFLRPVPGWAYYRTPIDNLYMCGSATHPGGGIMGAPGRLASQVILKDWSKLSSPLRSKKKSHSANNFVPPPTPQPQSPTESAAPAPSQPAPVEKN
jgi:phytoene dehydrogenase-like protein